MLKRKLFGDPEAVAKVENDRAPASIKSPPALFSDVERDAHEKNLRNEVKRVGKEIERLKPDGAQE
jgi:hypothetical protein